MLPTNSEAFCVVDKIQNPLPEKKRLFIINNSRVAATGL
jgi:hypothetical protein